MNMDKFMSKILFFRTVQGAIILNESTENATSFRIKMRNYEEYFSDETCDEKE